MRGLSAWPCALSAVALLALALPAAPVTPPGSAGAGRAGTANLRVEAQNYANIILNMIAEIENSYVRPVSRVELVHAALTGLYEAARQPVPTSLKQDIERTGEGETLRLLERVREQLGYADALRGNRAVLVSLQALPRVLDPYCGPVGPQTYRYLDNDGSATGLEFVGGVAPVTVSMAPEVPDRPTAPAGPVRIQTVIPGSSAAAAGLRPGDLIVKLNGRPPESREFAGFLQRLLPNPPAEPSGASSWVRLTVLRQGREEPFEVSLAPSQFHPETVFGARRRSDGLWDYMLDPADRIGYIRLGAINQNYTHPEFRNALMGLRNQSVRGLLLDLRWCPIGYLSQAATIARMLLPPQAQIASTRKRSNPGVEVVQALEVPADPYVDFPVVVLVNAETTGAGELIAAALQDSGRAVIAGQRTIGKATVQEQLRTIPFKLTTGTYERPSKKNLQRFPDSKPNDDWGVRPNGGYELPVTAELSRQLKEWWDLHTLRPAGSAEALPVDDPECDPQRHAAVQMVRELMKQQ